MLLCIVYSILICIESIPRHFALPERTRPRSRAQRAKARGWAGRSSGRGATRISPPTHSRGLWVER